MKIDDWYWDGPLGASLLIILGGILLIIGSLLSLIHGGDYIVANIAVYTGAITIFSTLIVISIGILKVIIESRK